MINKSTMSTKSCEKVALKFSCENCDYTTSRKSSYNKHLLTAKHTKTIEINQNQPKSCEKVALNTNYFCEQCNKYYKEKSGLWRHKQKCEIIQHEMTDKELIMMLIKQNTELMNTIKNGNTINSNNNNNNNNNNNKTFNLNFFLNEKCKNAININDFVSSIKPTLEDLEYTGRQGYVAGISNIILKKLNSLEEYIRPIHCCDQKREVLYIKDNDEWTKESEGKPILSKAIKMVANENIKNIKEWRDAHPHCTDSDSQKNNLYLKIVSNSMCGLDKAETEKNTNKIISNVAKEVTIERDDK